MSKYPEHEKLSAISDKSQEVGEFLEWMQYGKHLVICEQPDPGTDGDPFVRSGLSGESLLAEYFRIDLGAIERERRQMLDDIRALNQNLQPDTSS